MIGIALALLAAPLLAKEGGQPVFVSLASDTAALSAQGEYESPPIVAPFPFDEAVPSWNASTPSGARIDVYLKVRQDEKWGGWYKLGSWKRPPESAKKQEDGGGRVDVDTLLLRSPATAIRYRVVFDAPGRERPVLKLFGIVMSDRARWSAPEEEPFKPGPWVRDLPVPARSQRTEDSRYARDICSPTSLGMVAAYWGVDRPTPDWVRDVFDKATGDYGDWPFNVAAAAERGLVGWVTRLGSLSELEREIAAGRPTVVSVSWGAGELTGAPISKAKGHLLVVRGFTEKGDVIVNDPAAPGPDSVRRVYDRREFARAWLGNKRGLAYRIEAPPSARRAKILR